MVKFGNQLLSGLDPGPRCCEAYSERVHPTPNLGDITCSDSSCEEENGVCDENLDYVNPLWKLQLARGTPDYDERPLGIVMKMLGKPPMANEQRPAQGASSSSVAPGHVPFDGGKHLCRAHRPKAAERNNDPKYWFFKAARQGCKACVKLCIESHGIDKEVK